MLSQDNIDALLQQAEQAVADIAGDVQAHTPSEPSRASVSRTATVAPPPAAPSRPPAAAPRSPGSSTQLRRILKLKVPVVVRLAQRKMRVERLLKLIPGTILEFDRRVDQELDLLANNHQIGTGVAVKVDEHFGLRVTFIGDLKQRIESLGRG